VSAESWNGRCGCEGQGRRHQEDENKQGQLPEASGMFPSPFFLGPGHCDQRLTLKQTVDWNNGRAVAGDNESEILKMINSLPK
jgi:hypothetical protein